MFTGIVAAVGAIESVQSLSGAAAPGKDAAAASGLRLVVEAGGLGLDDVAIGDSIAIQGACMTAVDIGGRAGSALAANRFAVDVSRESLSKTAGLDAVGPVNLEKAMRLSDRIGGHLVSGHVDGLGRVAVFEPVGESWRLAIDVPADLARYFAYKGSVTVNGVSLTVNRVADDAPGADGPATRIEINLIPHTIEVTTLSGLRVGARVNLEIDLIARYVERMVRAGLVLPA